MTESRNHRPHNNPTHNHQQCIDVALDRAHRMCAQNGTRFTALRRQVFEQVWRGHDAVKAYDILEELGEPRRAAKPPTVYRALRFLQSHGLIHRLDSLNAFVGCNAPQEAHTGQFLICTECRVVSEFRDASLVRRVFRQAEDEGFAVERQTLEVHGKCAQCR